MNEYIKDESGRSSWASSKSFSFGLGKAKLNPAVLQTNKPFEQKAAISSISTSISPKGAEEINASPTIYSSKGLAICS